MKIIIEPKAMMTPLKGTYTYSNAKEQWINVQNVIKHNDKVQIEVKLNFI